MTIPRRLVPNLINLQAFECAARHGSFTRAGQELRLTQSAVSRQIQELEGQLGVRLFERLRQRVFLSAAGRKFLPEAQRLLSETEQTVIRVMARGEAEGILSIATLPTFGARWLAPRLGRFLTDHPNVVINMETHFEPFDFAKKDFDVAIHFGQPVWPGASCAFLCRETIVPVASPLLVPHGALPPDREVMKNLPLLHLATRPGLWSEWLVLHGLGDVPAFRGHRFDQFSMLIGATIAGLGLALLPRYLIEEELRLGLLRLVGDRDFETENAYYMVIPNGKSDHSLVSAFCAWLLREVAAPARRPTPDA